MPIGGTDDNMAPAPTSGGITAADVSEVVDLAMRFDELGNNLDASMATTDGRVAAMTSTVALIGKAANMLVGIYSRHAAEKPADAATPHASPKLAAVGAVQSLLSGEPPEEVVRKLLSQFGA